MTTPTQRSNMVPMGITIGLALFAIALSLGSFIPLPPEDRPLTLIAIVFGLHVLVVPAAFVLGGWIMRCVHGDQIAWRNSLSLGLLTSCIWMLWKMGTGV